MRPLTEDEVIDSFVNADDRELAVVALPHDFPLTEWDHLDFLAWRDPNTRSRGYLVAEIDGAPTGVVLRAASSTSNARHGICNICRTMQPGSQVTMFTARKAGSAGEKGDSIGTYICADLSCHENVRLALPLAPNEYRASVDRKIDGTARRSRAFVERVLEDAA
ncbi:FBP domain-containing protein [Microbacterium betulae]|uniref:FBP domain-containing protein n=1 Tax=Microbacterium betulae TaxID=2981139 RepID=A0AA97FI25_9MICO|nr:FBP domain-containing protein [Microbacterium sp. AB]WOF23636.1 FBP domain-containing protein [Microbacterium sp. AB]